MSAEPLYSVEDALKKITNKYEMTIVAATRVREMGNARTPGAASLALKDIADGKIDMQYYMDSLKGKKGTK